MTRANAFVACAVLGFRQSIRQWLFASVGLFAVMTATLALLGNELSLRQEEKILKDVGLATMELAAVFLALGAGVAAVSIELERRSFYFVLSRPVGRATFVAGKFAGVAIAQIANLFLMSIVLAAGVAFVGGDLDIRLALAVFGIAMQLVLVAAIALALSAWTAPTLATIGALTAYLAGRWSDVIRNARQIAPDTPQWLWDTLYVALPNYRYLDLKPFAIYDQPPAIDALFFIAGYAACYTAVAIAVAVAGFERRNLR